MDEAQLWRAAERFASARSRSEIDYSKVRKGIEGSDRALNRAYRESEHILAMYDAGEQLRLRAETAQREARLIESARNQLTGYVARHSGLWSSPIKVVDLLDYFIILSENMEVLGLLSGIYSSRFTRQWRSAICPDHNALMGEILNSAYDHRAVKAGIKMRARKDGWSGWQLGLRFFSDKTLDKFCQFIRNNGEGAIVVLTLLDAGQKRWWASPDIDRVPGTVFDYGYSAFNGLCIPTIEGLDPLRTMQLIEKLSAEVAKRDVTAERDKYYWLGEDITGEEHEAAFAYLRKRGWKSGEGKARGLIVLADAALAGLVGYEFYWLSREAHIAEARNRHEKKYAFPESRRSLLAGLTEIPEVH